MIDTVILNNGYEASPGDALESFELLERLMITDPNLLWRMSMAVHGIIPFAEDDEQWILKGLSLVDTGGVLRPYLELDGVPDFFLAVVESATIPSSPLLIFPIARWVSDPAWLITRFPGYRRN